MKTKELSLMSEQDLKVKIGELQKELIKVNTQIATRTVPKNSTKAKEIRRVIAKILTLQKNTSQRKEESKTNG